MNAIARLAKPSKLLLTISSVFLLTATPALGIPMVFTGTSSDGHPVSAIATFVLDDATDTVSVTLQNTTATTLDAGELFTGLDFTISGLTPSLTSATGIQRTVNGAGAFVDTGSPQNLSWSLASLGSGVYQLNFNPNAKDAIIGPPTAGNYAGANGSIKGNPGHNPFAAETADYKLSVPGLNANSMVNLRVFRFGTALDPANGTITPLPEPATAGLALAGLTAIAIGRLRRRAC